MAKTRTKRCFDDANLCRGRVKASKCAPVIDDQPGPDYVRSSIHGTSLVGEARSEHQPRSATKRENQSTNHQGNL